MCAGRRCSAAASTAVQRAHAHATPCRAPSPTHERAHLVEPAPRAAQCVRHSQRAQHSSTAQSVQHSSTACAAQHSAAPTNSPNGTSSSLFHEQSTTARPLDFNRSASPRDTLRGGRGGTGIECHTPCARAWARVHAFGYRAGGAQRCRAQPTAGGTARGSGTFRGTHRDAATFSAQPPLYPTARSPLSLTCRCRWA